MLYFFYGTDTDKAREKARALTDGLRKKKPDAEVFQLDVLHTSEAELDELIHGQGLFNKNYIVYAARLFENDEMKEAFLERLEDIKRSPNIFAVVEERVDKKTLFLITEAAERAQFFESKQDGKKPDFNIFSLTDAFGRRDKRNLWVLLQKAVASGAAPEEIHGVLFWQLKNMLLAKQYTSAEEAGVKPFVWNKARAFAKNWSDDELKALSGKMVALYHDAHRGICNFSVALERFALTI